MKHSPPDASAADEVLESVDGDLSVDGVKQSSEEAPYCPHDYEHYQVIRLPQLPLTLEGEQKIYIG